MSLDAGLVAVDVGNSAVKVAARRGESIGDFHIHLSSSEWENTAIDWVHRQLEGEPAHWRIASVHSEAASELTDALADIATVAVHRITHLDVPMPVKVDHPDRVGIDRILAAFAVRNRFDGPAVVVDAGSAVTIDLIDTQGHFCGGAILPGLGLQSSALAAGTDALPAIDWDLGQEIRLPATNTADAIRGGILAAIAAGIDGVIERYRGHLESNEEAIVIVLTGGDSPVISPHLRQMHRVEPNLVCRGLLELPRSGGG